MVSLKSSYDATAQESDNDEAQLAIDSRDELSEQELAASSAPGSYLRGEHTAAAQALSRRVQADIGRIKQVNDLRREIIDEMADGEDEPEPAFKPTELELLELALN